jgi:hypothetical protein
VREKFAVSADGGQPFFQSHQIVSTAGCFLMQQQQLSTMMMLEEATAKLGR